MVLSVGTGCMNIDQRENAWSILDGEATQTSMALNLARKAARQDDPSKLDDIVASRRLSHLAPLASELAPSAAGQLLGEPWRPAALDTPAWWPALPADDGRRLRDELPEDQDYVTLFVFYKSDKAGAETIFTPKRLQEICVLERDWVEKAEFVEIEVYDSVLGLFYGSPRPELGPLGNEPKYRFMNTSLKWSCEELSQESVDATVAAIRADIAAEGAKSSYGRFIHPDFASTGRSFVTRTFVEVIAQDAKKASIPDTVLRYLGRQNGFFQDGLFHSSAYMADEDRFLQKGAIRVRLVSSATDEFGTMVQPDFMLAILSVYIVWGVLWVYLRSFFLSSLGMFQIIASMPVGALIYKNLGIDYFEFLHILVVYLVLGIGADDIFVLLDTFRHIGETEAPLEEDGRYDRDTLHRILRKTWSRTAGSIFNTSFTTAMAFMSCSGSKAMPMRTCGWYAAIAIILNYIFTITFTPAVLVIWHKYIQGKRCCCPRWKLRPEGKLAVDGAKQTEKRLNFVEAFLDRVYIPAMQHKVGQLRPVPLAVALVMLGVAAQGVYFASQLTPPRGTEVWFPKEHMVLDISEFMGESFNTPAFDGYTVVELFWGIDGLDATEIDVYYPADKSGKVRFDKSFDLSTSEAQQFMLETCEELKSLKCSLAGCDNAGYGTLRLQTDSISDSCFLRDFQVWNNGTLPIGADFLPRLKTFRETARAQVYTGEPLQDEVDYERDIGIVNGQLRFGIIKIRSTMSTVTPFAKGTDIAEMLKRFVDERNAAAPASLKSLKYGGRIFANFDLSQELLSGLFSGCAIAAPIAFLVLLISTRNIILSVYAVVSVGAIVLCVLGFCKSQMDWDLGIGEAIAGVIVIGYSVDYVVHLAHIYCEAKHLGLQKREERAEFAVRNMGSTVFAGAITTAGSGAVMFFCFFYFFIKMAILICVTIMYSFLFSLGFFMSVVWLIGPEGNFGDIPTPSCLKGRESVARTPENKDVQPAESAPAGAEVKEEQIDEVAV